MKNPFKSELKDDYEGTIEIYESFRGQKSELKDSKFGNLLRPEVSFKTQMYYQKHDTRIQLSIDTFAQLVFGSGLIVKIKDKPSQKIFDKWRIDTDLDDKLEEGLPSYIGVGNLLFESAPNLVDFEELDIQSVEGLTRDKKGNVGMYIQTPNFNDVEIPAKNIKHFKLTGTNREAWARGLFFSLTATKELPVDGGTINPPIEDMWLVEEAMNLVFRSYASPIMMIHFKDAGEKFIKEQGEAFKKIKPGAKIITDKEFEVKVFEVNPNSKFDKYVEHLQKNVMEPGMQFPLGFFNAEFTARAASETSDNVLIRKVKRIQKRFAK
ncbi:MAG: hypothetical protein ACE5H1_01785, partial [Thermodesulfobacteriota bacterium]